MKIKNEFKFKNFKVKFKALKSANGQHNNFTDTITINNNLTNDLISFAFWC